MWYTHYNDAPITDSVNELYQELLKLIKTDQWDTLYDLACRYLANEDKHEVEYDAYFHEYSSTPNNKPSLSDQFTKTARKRYDPAVLLSYMVTAINEWLESAWDWNGNSTEKLIEHLKKWETQHAQNALLWYMDNEDIERDFLDKTKDETDKRAREMVDTAIFYINK